MVNESQQPVSANVLVTGGTSGIGKQVVESLCERGMNVLFTGTNVARGSSLEKTLRKKHPHQSIDFFQANNASMNDMRFLAEQAAQRFENLDILINNAGARNDSYAANADGVEWSFAANHLGHFLLTILLIPLVAKSEQGRIVHVGSRLHRYADVTQPWNIPKDQFDRTKTYALSKLANCLFSFELSQRFKGAKITSNCADPGIVASRFDKNNGLIRWAKHLISGILDRSITSAKTGAIPVLYLATSPEGAQTSGGYFKGRNQVEPSPEANNADLAEDLWHYSIKAAGVTDLELENFHKAIEVGVSENQ